MGGQTVGIDDRENYRKRNQQNVAATWTGREAYLLAAICLLAGMALGYLFRGSSSPVSSASSAAPATASTVTAPPASILDSQMPAGDSVDQLAAPYLSRVRNNPRDFDAFVQLGNIYMDHKQYSAAIDNYAKALEVRPDDVNVRTDMGTCYFYAGDAKRALAEFQKSLKIDPNHAQTLFNLGVVEQQGMNDNKAAVAAWQKLLATNPNYDQRAKVQELIAQARQ
jgi:cytochrome c-type biogenesis protein CcmH/NrfG